MVAFSGDNPSALIGMGANCVNDLVISLGTSDTIFLNLGSNIPEYSMDSNIFCSAIDADTYMALCCYKNGSLVRQKVLEEHSMPNDEHTWKYVSEVLLSDLVDIVINNKLFTI